MGRRGKLIRKGSPMCVGSAALRVQQNMHIITSGPVRAYRLGSNALACTPLAVMVNEGPCMDPTRTLSPDIIYHTVCNAG